MLWWNHICRCLTKSINVQFPHAAMSLYLACLVSEWSRCLMEQNENYLHISIQIQVISKKCIAAPCWRIVVELWPADWKHNSVLCRQQTESVKPSNRGKNLLQNFKLIVLSTWSRSGAQWSRSYNCICSRVVCRGQCRPMLHCNQEDADTRMCVQFPPLILT